MRRYISYKTRLKIERMINLGFPVPIIAETVGFHRQTIYRELRRCEPDNYEAEAAQRTAVMITNDEEREGSDGQSDSDS